jgi:hypothetical protein
MVAGELMGAPGPVSAGNKLLQAAYECEPKPVTAWITIIYAGCAQLQPWVEDPSAAI